MISLSVEYSDRLVELSREGIELDGKIIDLLINFREDPIFKKFGVKVVKVSVDEDQKNTKKIKKKLISKGIRPSDDKSVTFCNDFFIFCGFCEKRFSHTYNGKNEVICPHCKRLGVLYFCDCNLCFMLSKKLSKHYPKCEDTEE